MFGNENITITNESKHVNGTYTVGINIIMHINRISLKAIAWAGILISILMMNKLKDSKLLTQDATKWWKRICFQTVFLQTHPIKL